MLEVSSIPEHFSTVVRKMNHEECLDDNGFPSLTTQTADPSLDFLLGTDHPIDSLASDSLSHYPTENDFFENEPVFRKKATTNSRRKSSYNKMSPGGNTQNGTLASSSGDKRCQVCDDRAVNHNFGQLTCESCKAFFRRNAHKVEKLKCASGGDACGITSETRKQCPSCRLHKCFDIGMRADLIQIRKNGSKPSWLSRSGKAASKGGGTRGNKSCAMDVETASSSQLPDDGSNSVGFAQGSNSEDCPDLNVEVTSTTQALGPLLDPVKDSYGIHQNHHATFQSHHHSNDLGVLPVDTSQQNYLMEASDDIMLTGDPAPVLIPGHLNGQMMMGSSMLQPIGSGPDSDVSVGAASNGSLTTAVDSMGSIIYLENWNNSPSSYANVNHMQHSNLDDLDLVNGHNHRQQLTSLCGGMTIQRASSGGTAGSATPPSPLQICRNDVSLNQRWDMNGNGQLLHHQNGMTNGSTGGGSSNSSLVDMPVAPVQPSICHLTTGVQSKLIALEWAWSEAYANAAFSNPANVQLQVDTTSDPCWPVVCVNLADIFLRRVIVLVKRIPEIQRLDVQTQTQLARARFLSAIPILFSTCLVGPNEVSDFDFDSSQVIRFHVTSSCEEVLLDLVKLSLSIWTLAPEKYSMLQHLASYCRNLNQLVANKPGLFVLYMLIKFFDPTDFDTPATLPTGSSSKLGNSASHRPQFKAIQSDFLQLFREGIHFYSLNDEATRMETLKDLLNWSNMFDKTLHIFFQDIATVYPTLLTSLVAEFTAFSDFII